MSFDKEKVRRTAEKNLTQGKIQAAIKDYCQIVEHDQKDFNTLNMLGDLYVRVNQKDQAISCFKRLAEHYDAQGFTHKAIAVYKKILRLLPDSVEIAARLAPLYQTLGLIAEARSYYLTVAEDCQKKGDRLKTLEVWGQIADLDPNDTNTRLKLAENYQRENQTVQAAEAFTEAGNRLLAKKKTEEAINAFNRALEINPFEVEALGGAANASIELGFPEEAAGRLEHALANYPENTEFVSLLARVYIEAGNVELAEKYVGNLIERDPASYERHLDVVKLYLKDNNVAEAARVLGFSGELFITNNREEELLTWINEVLARNPEELTALRLLARVRAWQRKDDELQSALERLAEAANLSEDSEQERSALVELATLFPEDQRYAARLREMDRAAGIIAPENEPTESEPGESVPTFESFNQFHEETGIFGKAAEYESNAWQSLAEQNNDYSENRLANQFGENSFNDYQQTSFQTSEFNRSANSAVEFANNSAEFNSPNQFQGFDGNFQEPVAKGFENGSTSDFDFNGAPAVEPGLAARFEFGQSFDQPAPESQLLQELEGVDFYISQGLTDFALESLAQLETQFGAHPEINRRRERINPAASVVETGESTVATVAAIEQPVEAAEQAPALVVANAANLQAPEQPTKAVQAANGFEDLFAEFGEDIEVADLSAQHTADYETHYNLGLAYKDIGLNDDAVEEFQSAVKMVQPGDGTSRYLQCCHLIGQCFMDKDMPKLAAIWFERGVNAPGLNEDEYQALQYELGIAYEKAGEKARALELFAGIYAVNVGYRSVGEKVRSLQAA